ncbi:hypothetical protein DVR12_14005 [Chitinophaga silvatica]|uniref:PKD-like family protein n=1 Tax=Chitinophaga silvatica TaxID=2282649 RepID=A0A3E1Y8Q5_9BACT|nr:PKD-like family lipoprotein [Chitinophaga silvatica]RFS21770.1 hypothetical protein DVR12_14005 [Chitinophaga silvatica]
MKYLLYISLILMVACSKDKGNYDYQTLNDVVITGIKSGQDNDNIYNIVQGTKLIINPDVTRKLNQDPDLSYTWEIGKDTVGTDKNLDVTINLPFGKNNGRYTVKDNKTGVRYFTDFIVNVTSPYGKGYFILAESSTGNTMISFKSLINASDPIISTDEIAGVKYGKKPVNIMGYKLYASGPNDYKWQVFVTSQEGPNPTVFTDLTSFVPQKFINATSYLEGQNFSFAPTYATTFTSSTLNFFISGGKLITYRKGILYRPAAPDDADDYRLAPWIGTILTIHQSDFIGYDEKNERFRHFSVQPTDVVSGIYGDRFTYDKISEIPGYHDATKGQHFFAGGGWNVSTTQTAVVKAILKSGNKLHFYTLPMVYKSPATSPYIPVITKDAEFDLPGGLLAGATATLSAVTFDWYICNGNKIYRANSITPTLNDVITLPAGAGEIITVRLLENDTKLLVGTYKENASGDKKGSLYKIDIAGQKILEAYELVTGKPVDIFVAD